MSKLAILKSGWDCAWSALTYVFKGMPADKPSYFTNFFGFYDETPALKDAWARLKSDPSFHNSKNLWVEWVRSSPQRAGKLLALLVVLAFLGGALIATIPLTVALVLT